MCQERPHTSPGIGALDLFIEMEGYNSTLYASNYSTYSYFLQSIGIPHHDYLIGQPPFNIAMFTYVGDQPGAIVEIHEYESRSAAVREFELQREQVARGSPIFERFDSTERLMQRGRFLVFFTGAGADPIMNQFAGNMLNLLGEENKSAPPEVAYRGHVTWGIVPGDTISWGLNGTLFTGYVGGGMSHKDYQEEVLWEIADITPDNLAVLIRRKHERFVVFGEGFYEIELNIPYHTYVWKTADEPCISVETEGSYGVQAGIYPTYREGQSLREVIEGMIEHLPKKTVTETDHYLTGYGRTTSASGYTPIETQWIKITIHRGTGIVTTAGSYYNNNEYSITRSSSLLLKETNFHLSDRHLDIPELLPAFLALLLGMVLLPFRMRGDDGEPRRRLQAMVIQWA